MGVEVNLGTRRPPCRLMPPCKQGCHGSYLNMDGGHEVKTIGKYYFTEDALMHDLAALKRGEIYARNEFYKRAKAWYKAEIDRLLHLEKVNREEGKPATATGCSDSAADTSRRPGATLKTPTRIQPPRAAKRKTAEPATATRPPPRKKRAAAPDRAQNSSAEVPVPSSSHPQTDTQGDYTLAAYDWAQFLNGNQEEHRRSPWSYVQLQGLDVAYFSMRLERAVRAKIEELLSRSALCGSPKSFFQKNEKMCTNGLVETSEREAAEPEKQAAVTPPANSQNQEVLCDHQQLFRFNETRCALAGRKQARRPPPPPPPFEPAAALAPGEDWRPPTAAAPVTPPRRITAASPPAGCHNNADNHNHPSMPELNNAGGDEKVTATNHRSTSRTSRNHNNSGLPGQASWAAAEVSRRKELNRRSGDRDRNTPAPEADMEISPTLGRWFSRGAVIQSDEGGSQVPVEDLEVNVVEVSGLRFAVDLCAAAAAVISASSSAGAAGAAGAEPAEGLQAAVEEYARFVMM